MTSAACRMVLHIEPAADNDGRMTGNRLEIAVDHGENAVGGCHRLAVHRMHGPAVKRLFRMRFASRRGSMAEVTGIMVNSGTRIRAKGCGTSWVCRQTWVFSGCGIFATVPALCPPAPCRSRKRLECRVNGRFSIPPVANLWANKRRYLHFEGTTCLEPLVNAPIIVPTPNLDLMDNPSRSF